MLKVLAPAKINLTLEVLARRPDGYHEISSVMQGVGLFDELFLEVSEGLTLATEGLDVDVEDNLVMKAARLLQSAGGTDAGARIYLKKVIPAAAGLGGGSSDAAAALKALNQLWHLGMSLEELAALGSGIGSDVSFFIYGGTAMAGGKGEKITPVGPITPAWIVLCQPPVIVPPDKTRRMYGSLRAADFTDGHYTARMVEKLDKERCIDQNLVFNVFETVALSLFPDLSIFYRAMKRAGSEKVIMAGSGPALYSIFPEESAAAKVYSALMSGGTKVYLVKTVDQNEW